MVDAGLSGTTDPLLSTFEWRGMVFDFSRMTDGAPTAFARGQSQDEVYLLGGQLRVIDWRKFYQRKFSASAGGLPYGTGATPLAALEDWRAKVLGHAAKLVALLDYTDREIEARPRE